MAKTKADQAIEKNAEAFGRLARLFNKRQRAMTIEVTRCATGDVYVCVDGHVEHFGADLDHAVDKALAAELLK